MPATRSYDTVQNLRDEQAPAFDTSGVYFIVANGLTYKWNPTSVQADDGKLVVRPTSRPAGLVAGQGAYEAQTAGEAVEVVAALKANTQQVDFNGASMLMSDAVVLNSLGGGQDDWPTLLAAMQQWAYKRAIVLAPGTWNCKSAWTGAGMLSGTVLIGGPGVKIVSSLTPTGGPGGFSQTPFYASSVAIVGKNQITFITTAPTYGSYTAKVSDVTQVAVGDIVLMASVARNLVQQAKVVSINAGASTITLDQPILYPFNVGDTVQAYAVPQDIYVFGGGMIVTGTGDRAFELAAARKCLVQDVKVTRDSGSFTAIVGSFDTGSDRCSFVRVSIDGAGTSAVGLALESATHSHIEDCDVAYCGTAGANCGFYLTDVRASDVTNSRARQCYFGMLIAEGGSGDTMSSRDLHIQNCTLSDNNQTGVYISGGCRNLKFHGVSSQRNGAAGFVMTSDPDGAPVDVQFVDCMAESNGSDGFQLGSANGIAHLTACRSEGNTGYGLNTSLLKCTVDDFSCEVSNTGGGFQQSGTGRLVVDKFDVTQSGAGADFLYVSAAGEVVLGSGIARLAANSNFADVPAAGTLRMVGDIRTTGGNFGLYMGHGVACVFYREGTIDLSSCATPWTFDATCVVKPFDLFGSGTPLSVVLAPVGSTYRRTDGGASTSFYVKESGGANTSTGWVAK